MSEQPSFPPEVLAVLGDIYSFTSPRQGATSQVWIVECAAGERVVKHASRAPYIDWLMNEGAVLKNFNSATFLKTSTENLKFPFPKLYLDGSMMKVERSIPYLVMGWLPGEPLATVMSRENDPNRRLQWMSLLGATLRKVHDFPGIESVNKRWLEERLKTAAGYIEAGFDLDADDPPHLLEYLRANRPKLVPQTLIHGDFMWDNVLVQDNEITGIVDWGGGAYGDPRYDLALAILPHEDGELSNDEVATFYAAYGCDPLTEAEYRYFTNLYGFF
jgi:aminoglycoside phosphotransferase (APT) family kinase protein